ncbi:LEPR-XLL domain-containing protein [Devosia chinhatensis]|uniref:LEPR-XLL domain-containing protein n=1 Tax=Devosia aurantiaca TaxID=2714858 RepID=A0A6M1T111_9HYPH|nr:LEPR-XLL domain-containing protein [Devosia aurantiaca]
MIFDPLEPRLLLNGDLSGNSTVTLSANLDHDILVRMIEEIEKTGTTSNVIQKVEIIDQAQGGKVLAFGNLSTISGSTITIRGGAGNDVFRIDEDSFGSAAIPSVAIDGGGGSDTIVFDTSDSAEWRLDGANAGRVGTTVRPTLLTFSEVENLRGSDGNIDVFKIASGGSLSGKIDGGYGGKDTFEYLSGVTASSAYVGASGTGSVTLGGHTLNFANLEPFTIGGGVQVVDRSSVISGATNKDVLIAANGNDLSVTINGVAQTITRTESNVWLYLGDAANVTTISSLPSLSGFSLTVDGGEEIVVNSTLNISGKLALSAEDINIGSGVLIQATSIDLRAIDFAYASINAGATNSDGDNLDSTLTVTGLTSATITIAGQLRATSGAVWVSAQAANTVKMHGRVSEKVRFITTNLTNTATINVTGSITGSSVKVSADTDVNVDIKLTEVPIPNLLGLAEITIPTSIFSPTPALGKIVLPQSVINSLLYPNHYQDDDGNWRRDSDDVIVTELPPPAPSFNTFDAAFADIVESGQVTMDEIKQIIELRKNELKTAWGNLFDFDADVEADVNVTNTTTVAVSKDARISGSAGAIDIAADDTTFVRDVLQTEVDSVKPKLATMVVFSAIDSDTTVNRTTGVSVGVPVGEAVTSARPNVLSATGHVSVTAKSSGEVLNDIVSNQIGSATNEANETTTALVRGVQIANGVGTSPVASVVIFALSDTAYSARSLDSENELIGATTAKLEASNIYAGSGGLTISASDKSSVLAESIPFMPPLDPNGADPDPTIKKFVGRVSNFNEILKDTLASIVSSVVHAAGDVVVKASNITTVTAFAEAIPQEEAEGVDPLVSAQKVNAGIFVANIVNGSTKATIKQSEITTTGVNSDVVVKATDDSFIDASIFVNFEGVGVSGAKLKKMLKGGAASAARMEAMNIIGFRIGQGPQIKGNDLALQKATLDALLGTQFFQDPTQVEVKASITDSTIVAAGLVSALALSKGVVNATVSSASTQSADVGILKTGAKVMGAALANNQVNRLASAVIDGGASKKSVRATGALTVQAQDQTLVNSNVKLSGSAVASTDGGFHALERFLEYGLSDTITNAVTGRESDNRGITMNTERTLTDGVREPVKYGTKVGLDYDLVTTRKNPLTISHGQVLLVSQPGSVGKLYEFVGIGSLTVTDWKTGAPDFSDTTKWRAIKGEPGDTYTYLGADLPNLDLRTVDFTDKNLWKPDLDYSILTDKYNVRSVGAAVKGQVFVLNDLRGGATALLTNANVDADSVLIDAKSIGTINATSDVYNEVQGGGAFDEKRVLKKVAPKGVKGLIVKKVLAAGTTKSQTVIISTNLIQGETTAKIVNASVGTSSDKVGAVTVQADNSSTITAKNSAISIDEGAKKMEAMQIANNTIGWERSNLLFNTVETLLGDFVEDTTLAALREQTNFNVDALISGSTVWSSGAVTVDALSAGLITAVLDNKTSGAFQSLAQTKSSSLALAISGNKISNSATAKINLGSTVNAGSVRVNAANSAVISTLTNVGADNKTATTYGTDVVSEIVSAVLDDYKYTTKSGTPGSVSGAEKLQFGDKVRVAYEINLDELITPDTIDVRSGDRIQKNGVLYEYKGTSPITSFGTLKSADFSDTSKWAAVSGKAGQVYQYMGADTDQVNLALADFSDFGLWKLLNTEAIVPAAFAQTARFLPSLVATRTSRR